MHAKRAKGIDYEFRLNRFASSAADMRVVDLKGQVAQGLARIKASVLGRVASGSRKASILASQTTGLLLVASECCGRWRPL